jgi:hypothetical protein
LVIYPGSSGNLSDPFLEIAVWQHFTEKKTISGKDIFKDPKIGSKIKILGLK